MNNLFNIFSTRELAIVIWFIILLTGLLIWNKGRYHLKDIAKSTFDPSIVILYISLIIYIFAIILLLWKFKLWNITLLKDTIIWFLFTALGVFFSLNKVKNASYFGQLIKNSISATVIFEFFINLYTFNLFFEFIILPCLIFLFALNAYSEVSAKINKECKKFYSYIDQLLGIIGLIYIGFVLYKTIIEFKTIPWINMSKQFLLPIILTLLSIPYFWVLALYMRYETIFIANNRIFKERCKIAKLKIKFHVLYYGNFSFKRIDRIWKKIGYLPYEESVNYKKYIKHLASPPAYKKSPIISKMKIKLFNDIDACCKSLSKLEIGEFSEWNKRQSFDEFYCSTDYYSIQPYGLSNVLLSLQGEEFHIHQLELSLSILSIEEREKAILKFKECAEKIFRLLSLQISHISNSILEGESYNFSNDNFSIELAIEVIGKVESFILVIKSN